MYRLLYKIVDVYVVYRCISAYTCCTHCTMLPAEYTIAIQYTSLYIAIHIQHYTAYTLYIAIHSPSDPEPLNPEPRYRELARYRPAPVPRLGPSGVHCAWSRGPGRAGSGSGPEGWRQKAQIPTERTQAATQRRSRIAARVHGG